MGQAWSLLNFLRHSLCSVLISGILNLKTQVFSISTISWLLNVQSLRILRIVHIQSQLQWSFIHKTIRGWSSSWWGMVNTLVTWKPDIVNPKSPQNELSVVLQQLGSGRKPFIARVVAWMTIDLWYTSWRMFLVRFRERDFGASPPRVRQP